METFDRWMLRESINNMIELSDIKYIPHYRFENLEWMIIEEVRHQLELHPIENLTKSQCELVAIEICKHVFTQIEIEKTNFFLYHLPEFISDLYIKTNKICTQ